MALHVCLSFWEKDMKASTCISAIGGIVTWIFVAFHVFKAAAGLLDEFGAEEYARASVHYIGVNIPPLPLSLLVGLVPALIVFFVVGFIVAWVVVALGDNSVTPPKQHQSQ